MIAIAALQEKYGAEVGAIVLACRVFFGTAPAAELQQFIDGNNIDWVAFHKLVAAHRIRPVINKVISSLDIPANIKSLLQAEATQIALRNFEQYREQQRLMTALRNAGVMFAPYKGCAYSLQFYGDLSMRESTDIDFIMPNEVSVAGKLHTVMLQQGYVPVAYIPEEFSDFYHAHVREYKYIYKENDVNKFLVEFHPSLSDTSFETTTPITNDYFINQLLYTDNGVPTLSPTAHTVALITHHGIREQWSSFKNIMDIAIALTDDQVDCPAIAALADETHFRKVFDIGLTIINDITGVTPKSIQVRSPDTNAWQDNLLSPAPRLIDRTWRNNFRLKLKAKDNNQDRVGLLLAHAAYATHPSLTDYTFLRLPKPLFFLYVFIKPLRKLITSRRS